MIKQIRASYFANFKNAQYCALSSDPIPDYLENGDKVYLIDKGKNYIWDASSSSLIEDKTAINITEINDTLDTKAPAIINTASGAIASFDDGANGMPIKKLVAQIEPVQDLHGYDNPWPAGGGKNVFTCYDSTFTTAGLTVVCKTHYVEISGTCTTNTALNLSFGSTTNVGAILGNGSTYTWSAKTEGTIPNTLDIYGGYLGTETRQTGEFAPTGSQSLTIPSDGVYQDRVWIGVHAGETYNGTLYIQTEKGSVKTDYAPWENLCPISGWRGLHGGVCGKNLLRWRDNPSLPKTQAGITYKDAGNGQIEVSGTATGLNFFNIMTAGLDSDLYPLKPGETYFFSAGSDNNSVRMELFVDGASVQYEASFSYTMPTTFTSWYVRLRCTNTAKFLTPVIVQPFICLESEPQKAFEPYNGELFFVNWETEAGTVYGGTPDVISGKMVVDRAFVEFDEDTNITFNNHGVPSEGENFNYWFSCYFTPSNVTNNYDKWLFSHGICSSTGWSGVSRVYKVASTNRINMVFGVNEDVSNTAGVKNFFAAQKTAGTPVQLVYTLASPIEYQFTPQEVTTLLGINNVWADTGDIQTCEYPADTKLYIDGKIAEALGS